MRRLAKVAVLLFVASLLASPGFAQTTFGAKIGVNFANISLDPDDGLDTNIRTGLAIGGFVDVPFNDRFSFQPEVLYSQGGSRFEDSEDSGEKADLNFDFVELPLLLKAGFPTSGSTKPFLVFGPGLGFRTSAKIESSGEEQDLKDDTESFNFSLIFGGGVAFGPASVEVRYDLGLTDLSTDEDSAKSRVFSILFGYGFGH